MSREQYIKRLIKERGSTIKEFAKEINMPYSTLLSMLNGSIGGAAVDSAIKICQGLGITVADLQKHVDNYNDDGYFALTEDELRLITQYRLHPGMQSAVRKLLDLDL